MAPDASKSRGVNHRAEVGRELGRVAGHQLTRGTHNHLDHRIGYGLMQAQQAQRRAALAGAAKGALHHGVCHLLGQGSAVDQHGVDAAGLGNQRHDGAVLGGQRAVDQTRHLGRAGEHHTRHARCCHQSRTHRFARAVQQLQRALWHAGGMQQLHRRQRHARRLLGRLGQHRVAGGQRGRHLPGEDGQREVPGADADPGAPAFEAQGVALAGGPGKGQGSHHALGFIGVVTQEVDRLAHLGHRVAPALVCFFHEHGAQVRQLLLHGIGSTAQRGSALGHRGVVPAGKSLCRPRDGCLCVGGRGLGHGGQHQRGVRHQQRGAVGGHSQVQALAVGSCRAVQNRWQWQRRCRGLRLRLLQRRDQQLVHAHRFVGELVHERRVGTVLQQAAHQVGQQVAMRAHRCVDAAGNARLLQHLAVDALTHAVQALQFKPGLQPAKRRSVGVRGGGHLEDGRNGCGVVRGELRKDRIGGIEQSARASQIAHVGVRLLGEHRVAGQAQLLRTLDFCIPVSPLDQAAHELQSVLPRQRRHVFDQIDSTRLIGLKCQAKTLPLGAMLGHQPGERLEHVEREFEPVHLFCIDGQIEIGRGSALAQQPDAGHQLPHHALVLGVFVARVQCAELDRDAVVLARRALRVGGARDRGDGVVVAGEVAQCVIVGAGALAQHVEAETQPRLAPARRRGLLHALLDRLPQHELATQQLHRAQRGGHHRLGTQPAHESRLVAGFRQELLRHRDGGGRQSRQCRGLAASPGFARPPGRALPLLGQPAGRRGRAIKIRPAELVGRERDRGCGIGHTQQRLGQAHQGQAFGTGNRVLLQQTLHGPERRRVLSHLTHPGGGGIGNGRPVERALQGSQAVGQYAGFGAIGKRKAVCGAGHRKLQNGRGLDNLRMFPALKPHFSPNLAI